MRNSVRVALASLALFAAVSPGVAHAQQPTAPASNPQAAPQAASSNAPHRIGLIDMAYIYDHYEKMVDRRESLKKEMETTNSEVTSLQTQLQEVQKTLQSDTLKKESPAWQEQQQKFIELRAQLQAKVTNINLEFARKEAKLYKEIHEEVSLLVKQYAEFYKYTLILKHQRAIPEEVEERQKVFTEMMKLVVYHQANDDITDQVLTFLNDRYRKTAGKPAAAPAN